MFRILSLDGGGIMGAFTAGVLSAFEKVARDETGHGVADQFDLITGTSIGGVTALGLGTGATPDRILQLYRQEGAGIFLVPAVSPAGPADSSAACSDRSTPPMRSARPSRAWSRTRRSPRRGHGSSYRPMTPPVAACMCSKLRMRTRRTLGDADKRVVDVALATSAAPTYFPAHTVPDRGAFVDGGVWANCPVMLGIIEAVEFCKRRLDEIAVLSVSTTSYPFRLGDKQQRGGLFGWGPKIIETFMFGQVQNAVAQATCLLRERFHRVDYDTAPNLYKMDDARVVEELITLGIGVGQERKHTDAFRRTFLRPVTDPATWPARQVGQ